MITTKGDTVEDKILCLGIENEFEGDSPMWFDLNEPLVLANYLRDNIDEDQIHGFTLKKLTKKEFEELN